MYVSMYVIQNDIILHSSQYSKSRKIKIKFEHQFLMYLNPMCIKSSLFLYLILYYKFAYIELLQIL